MIKKEFKILLLFLLLIVITIVASIIGNAGISNLWGVILLIAYYNSKNESFWLAFFLATTDGFMGFLGVYSTLLSIVPGMPGIELAQFYILVAAYKISKNKIKITPFYKNWSLLLFSYVILLLFVGMANGFSGDLNVYFKVAKMILPLGLFYTTPRLIRTIDQYASLMNVLFFIFIFACVAQLFTVFTGFSPAAKFKAIVPEEMEMGRNLRSGYNSAATLVSLCGALFFLTLKQQNYFSKLYLNIIVILCFAMAFLSATRGWIIGIGFVIVMYNVFIKKLEIKSLLFIVVLFIALFALSLSFERLNQQIKFAFERSLTLEALAKGDNTADGTLIRLERGPVVMEAWADNPVFGWGFSNFYFEKDDIHVGNQNLLLHSGIVGLTLMCLFMIYVCSKLISLNRNPSSLNPYKKAGTVIPVFLIGWLFIHSTSSQQFAYFGVPLAIFPQAIVLALANFVITYNNK